MTGFAEKYLLDPAVNANPYDYLSALHEYRPVYWSTVHRAWLVTGYSQVVQCLREPAISASRVKPIMERMPQSSHGAEERAFGILSGWMVFNDPPAHRRLRAVFQEQFSARSINRFRSVIEAAARGLLSRRAVSGNVGDAVADVAKPLPSLIFARWLGIPRQHSPAFWYWNARISELVLGSTQPESEYRTSIESLLHLYDYLADLVRLRRDQPGDDLISSVLAGGQIGESVTDDEFIGLLTHLAFAGGETTSNLIANGLRALLQHPGELDAVRGDPDLLPGCVEEVLRFDGPSKMSIRIAASDFKLGGTTICAGDRIYLITAAANRDLAQFPDPDRFTAARSNTMHLGFGFGEHFCIGAPLARLVARAAIGALVRDYPSLELVDAEHTWHLSLLNRSLTTLPVRY
jgi:cytochrome P450